MELFKITHGQSGTRMYHIWKHIRQRCDNPNTEFYHRYGGRGIAYCEEWNDFQNFHDWSMKNGYREDLEIDRENNDGNYTPLNCRWVTESIQAQNKNKYKNNKSGYIGVSWHKSTSMYRAYISVNKNIKHLGIFNTALEASIIRDNYIKDNNLSHTLNHP